MRRDKNQIFRTLVSLSYLWRRDQAELFDEMIDAKVEAILIKVATLGLDEKHLGLSLSQVRDHLHKMVNIIYLAHQIQQSIPMLIFMIFCPIIIIYYISKAEIFYFVNYGSSKVSQIISVMKY